MKKTHLRTASIKAKSNAKYICQECGSTEFIQAHHEIPGNDSTIVVLCGMCHSKRHPDVPLGLFFAKNHQPYWENISASSLAKELGRHPRTICRLAKKLNIPCGVLTDEHKLIIRQSLRNPYTKHYSDNSRRKDTPPNNRFTNSFWRIRTPNEPRPPFSGYFTVKEISAKLDVHCNTLWRWLTNGTIKGVKFGKLWRIPDTEIERVAKEVS